MAKKRKNFIREKRIYCGEEYLEVDIVAVTNMPEAGKGKRGKSSQAQKNLNDKRSKRRFVQIANTNFGTNDFHISATYNNEHLPMSLEEAEKNVHNYLDRIKRKMKRETGEDLKYMLVTEYTPEEEEGQLTLQGIDTDDKTTKAVRIHHHIIINSGGLDRDDLELMWSTTRINWKKANDPEYRANPDWEGDANAGLLFVYMCERLTEAPSRIHTIMVCKLMIPLIWEKLEQELQETAAVADKKIKEDTAQGGLLSAT